MTKSLIEIAEDILNESNLSRLLSHTQNREVGILTASRQNLPDEENVERYEKLRGEIRAHGFGYVPVNGKYIEHKGTDHETPVNEKAFVVIGSDSDDGGKLKDFLLKHGEKYDQDSILHKPHDTEEAVLIGTNENAFPGKGNTHPVGTFKPNRVGEFHSMLRNGRTFTFEETAQPQKTFLNRSDT
jgi:hypothetical protein